MYLIRCNFILSLIDGYYGEPVLILYDHDSDHMTLKWREHTPKYFLQLIIAVIAINHLINLIFAFLLIKQINLIIEVNISIYHMSACLD
jgi:hypothetical protein